MTEFTIGLLLGIFINRVVEYLSGVIEDES